MDCKHCFHWDKASETFNTEIESCCDCGYVKFPRLNNAELAIARVRELHIEDVSGYCEICPDFEYPCNTIKALDGEK